MKSVFVLGTDTSAGKTFASAVLMLRYPQLLYWKAVQTGYPEDDDCKTVRDLTNLPGDRFLDTGFTFREPLSPHRASELENQKITASDVKEKYRTMTSGENILVEGAGGLLVPLNRNETWMDFLLMEKFQIVIASRTTLGTINHTLLTIRCLEENRIRPSGIIFCGKYNEDNIRTIHEFSGIPVLGHFYHEAGSLLSAGNIDLEGILDKNTID